MGKSIMGGLKSIFSGGDSNSTSIFTNPIKAVQDAATKASETAQKAMYKGRKQLQKSIPKDGINKLWNQYSTSGIRQPTGKNVWKFQNSVNKFIPAHQPCHCGPGSKLACRFANYELSKKGFDAKCKDYCEYKAKCGLDTGDFLTMLRYGNKPMDQLIAEKRCQEQNKGNAIVVTAGPNKPMNNPCNNSCGNVGL